MKVLVTGGAGFIGSHVAGMLADSGCEVTVVDDLSTGHRQNLPAGVAFEHLDIREQTLENLLERLRPRAIAHLAAQVDVRASVAGPVRDADINVLGTIRLAQAATAVGCEKIVFASTGGAIYGEQEVFPAPEDHPCRPVSPYGVAKLSAEHYLALFERAGGPKAVSLRLANVYGPRQDSRGEVGVVAIFSERMLSGQTAVIFGDGGQTRDYVFVEDVARAFSQAIDITGGGVFNIGTGVETDINRLASMVSQACDFEQEPVHEAARPGEQRRSCIDPSLAAAELGWEPRVDLRTGLARTIHFFSENQDR